MTLRSAQYHDLPLDSSALEYVLSQSVEKEYDRARQLLGASGLIGADHSRKIGDLSGGQKARVYFSGIIISNPDIVLFDEPTNHLDNETVEGLKNGLSEFEGAAVVVSHDSDFLQEIGSEVWLIEEKQAKRLGEGIDGLEIYIDSVIESFEE